mmetsp:Transcript_2575/g.7576  ORF Transcript_2575/g.7576 Transcript_2575/m.7576 type:complete len:189 (-) Transcript_2575:317-883(-)
MFRVLQCTGLGNDSSDSAFSFSRYFGGGSSVSKYWTAHVMREEEEARVRAIAERTAAKAELDCTLKKISRRGIGLSSTRHVYVTEDEAAIAYAKLAKDTVEKLLPFAEMDAPDVHGPVVTVTMRNQATSTAAYKFQFASEDDAIQWAEALLVFLPDSIKLKVKKAREAPAAAVKAPPPATVTPPAAAA